MPVTRFTFNARTVASASKSQTYGHFSRLVSRFAHVSIRFIMGSKYCSSKKLLCNGVVLYSFSQGCLTCTSMAFPEGIGLSLEQKNSIMHLSPEARELRIKQQCYVYTASLSSNKKSGIGIGVIMHRLKKGQWRAISRPLNRTGSHGISDVFQ